MRGRPLVLQLCSIRGCSSSPSTSSVYNFVRDLSERGLIADSHPAPLLADNEANLKRLPPSVYAGFDPTAPSLHVGNLVVLLSLFRSSSFGCRPLAIIGGATALVGDPSGRTTDRDASRLGEAHANKVAVGRQIERLWSNARKRLLKNARGELECIDNTSWYKEMRLLDFLDYTRPLRVGEMLRTRAIRSRLEAGAGSGVSFPEFVYQSLQAYDWLRLARDYGCQFQLGGSDQLGHLDIGAHFIGRSLDKWAAGVCVPLLTDANGHKLGKSTGGGGVWLDCGQTSPFHLFQFFRQLHDDQAVIMLKRCSLRPVEELTELEAEHSRNLGKWIVQQALAEEMVEVVHGREAVEMAQTASRALFSGSLEAVESLPVSVLEDVFGRPIELDAAAIQTFGDLADRTRTDKQKGSVNDVKHTVAEERLGPGTIGLRNAPTLSLVRWGKRTFQLVRWKGDSRN